MAYRKAATFELSASAAAAWLRRGEIEALQAECLPYDERKFRQALRSIRGMTKESVPSFAPATKKMCASAGVAVLFVHELPLIPLDDWGEFVADGIFEEAAVDRFAKRQGIAAGIVVGRLQREKHLSYRTHLNSKKVRLRWADD